MQNLLPCPKCGSKYVKIVQDGEWFIGFCEPVECSLTSARFRDKNDCIEWWNKRCTLIPIGINAVVEFLDNYPIKSNLCFDMGEHECSDLADEIINTFGVLNENKSNP